MKNEMSIYFNWSLNALVPINTGAADKYLIDNKAIILKVAKWLLVEAKITPTIIYRGLVMRNPVSEIAPNKNLEYLSFTTDHAVAAHFADVDNGFGSQFIDIKLKLGNNGYIIEYTPQPEEILFHNRFLSILPYVAGLNSIGMDGEDEVMGLMRQKEVMILQPKTPFTNITKTTL